MKLTLKEALKRNAIYKVGRMWGIDNDTWLYDTPFEALKHYLHIEAVTKEQERIKIESTPHLKWWDKLPYKERNNWRRIFNKTFSDLPDDVWYKLDLIEWAYNMSNTP